jgi:iron complex outermembrane recepter protein
MNIKKTMNRLKHAVPLLFAFFCLCFVSMAQQEGSQIKGYVFGPGNEPALYSTVVLLNKDSVLVKGTLSQLDGLFLLEKIEKGDYFLQIRNIEFNTYTTGKFSVSQNDRIDLENILLSPSNTKIDEVVVTAQKALIEVHPDKMVFNVASSVNASGSNGLELLSKAPGVLLDMDNNIILQGKSGVIIYINGRPSRLSGQDLTNMLQGMRSDNIESVEIITNPSSKYDAEGTAGIINIVMKKNLSSGFNGNMISSFTRGEYSRSNIGTTFYYNSNKISSNSGISLTQDDFMDRVDEQAQQSGYLLDKESSSVNKRKGINLNTGLDYTLSEKSTFSFDGRVFLTLSDKNLQSNTIIKDAGNQLPAELLKAETLDEIPSSNYTLNMNYHHIPNASSSLSADLSYGRFTSKKDTRQPNTYYAVSDNSVLRKVNSRYDSDTNIDLWSGMIDYENKIGPLTLSTGAKYSYISTDNRLGYYNIVEGNPVFDITRSNDFTYLEKVAALYAIVNMKPTQKITLNAGLRMENTSSLGSLVSPTPVENSEVPRNYTDLFPNISVSYNDDKNHAISLSYGSRITRPDYQSLNPFESRMSELSAWKGNPFLKPNYITNYQVTYAFKRKLVITNTYSITRDFFATIFEIVNEKGTRLIPRNMDKSTNNGLTASYSMKIASWWEFASFFLYNYSTFDGDLEGTVIDLEAHIYNFRFQNSIKLPEGILMELTYYWNSPSIWRGSVEIEKHHGLNFGVRKDFLNRKLLVQLTGNDIFRTGSDFFYKSNYGGMVVDGVITFDIQRFGFSLTYNFGNQQEKTRKRSRSAIEDEMRRISQ